MGVLRRGGANPGRRRPLAAAAVTGAVIGATGARTAAGQQAVAGGARYQMRQRVIAIGDDFEIRDDQGRTAFKVDGKALRLRSTLFFEDAQGAKLYKIQSLHFKHMMKSRKRQYCRNECCPKCKCAQKPWIVQKLLCQDHRMI